jgi:hypothetical protein
MLSQGIRSNGCSHRMGLCWRKWKPLAVLPSFSLSFSHLRTVVEWVCYIFPANCPLSHFILIHQFCPLIFLFSFSFSPPISPAQNCKSLWFKSAFASKFTHHINFEINFIQFLANSLTQKAHKTHNLNKQQILSFLLSSKSISEVKSSDPIPGRFNTVFSFFLLLLSKSKFWRWQTTISISRP